MIVEIALVLFTIGLAFVFLRGRYNESYWKKRGIKFHSKSKALGPFYDFLVKDRAMFEILGDLYKKYKGEPAVGIGSLLSPTLFVLDPINVSHVLQTDFNAFHHRGIENIEGDQLTESVLFMNGPKWKVMRQNMTPLFTGNKLKSMYYILDRGAQDFVKYLKEHPETQKGEAFNTMTTYCSAALIASVFGIGTESIFDSPFLQITRDLAKPSRMTDFKFFLTNLSPALCNFLGIKIFQEHEKFFVGSIQKAMEMRKEEGKQRHDFIDIAVHLEKNGLMKDTSTNVEMTPTVGLLSAQAFFFFIAGVDPSATTMVCTLFELGRNPEVLRKVQEEIDTTFNTHKEISYDVINKMVYFEKVLSESMRKFPPVGYLTRQCTQTTVLPVGNIKVEEGTKVFTPLFDIHRDPKYYPDPEVFDPERFSGDGLQPISDTFYMPFGRGGRTCIGARLARLQMKAGLVHLLRQFTPKALENGPIQYRKENIFVRPTNIDVALITRDV